MKVEEREKRRIQTILRVVDVKSKTERNEEAQRKRLREENKKLVHDGYHRSTIYKWMKIYDEEGMKGLKNKPFKKSGRPSMLSDVQRNGLLNSVLTKKPRMFQFDSKLWTRSIVQDVIRKDFFISLSEASISRLFKKLGLCPEKSKARKFNKVSWLAEKHPSIHRSAKCNSAKIYTLNMIFIDKGRNSKAGMRRHDLHLMSAVSAQGKELFMVIEGVLNDEKFIEFLENLIHDIDAPIFLIAESNRVYKSKKVREFTDSTKGRLNLFSFTSRSVS